MKTAKHVGSASRAIGMQRAVPVDGRAAIGRGAPERFRLRYLLINCPSCGKFQHLDADTPRQVFDPELHRFACPACLEVIRLLPYPLLTPETSSSKPEPWADVLAAAADLVSHPLCAGIGIYEPADGSVGRDHGVLAQYLYLPVPEHTVM